MLTSGVERADEVADLKVFQDRLAALGKYHDAQGSGIAKITSAIRAFEAMDAKLYATVRAGDSAGAEKLVAGSVDAAADGVTSAIDGYIAVADAERTEADARFASLQSDARRKSVVLGALALLAALSLAVGLGRHLTRRLRQLSRAAEALAEGDVDHDLSVRGRDEVGRTAGALATMLDHLRSLAGAADRVAAGDLTVDVQPRSGRDRLGAAFAGLVAELRTAVGQMSRTATNVAGTSELVAASSADAGRAVEEIARPLGDVAAGAERQVRHPRARHQEPAHRRHRRHHHRDRRADEPARAQRGHRGRPRRRAGPRLRRRGRRGPQACRGVVLRGRLDLRAGR